MDRALYLNIVRERMAMILEAIAKAIEEEEPDHHFVEDTLLDPKSKAKRIVDLSLMKFQVSSQLRVQWCADQGLSGKRVHIRIFLLPRESPHRERVRTAIKALGIPNIHIAK